MNSSAIEWCDKTWNVITGCRRHCPYCYARRMAARFAPKESIPAGKVIEYTPSIGPSAFILLAPIKDRAGNTVTFPTGFEPTFHPYRLGEPLLDKVPRRIFVCSMADFAARDVPDAWREIVFHIAAAATWHTFIFLTKETDRLSQIASRMPDNVLLGVTCTDQASYNAALGKLVAARGAVRKFKIFMSFEPLLGPIDLTAPHPMYKHLDWIIIGAETKNGKPVEPGPDSSWVGKIVADARAADIPIFIKDNLLLTPAIHGIGSGSCPREFERGAA